jgi:hypothetical protein
MRLRSFRTRHHGVYHNHLGVVSNGRFAVVGKTGDRAPSF